MINYRNMNRLWLVMARFCIRRIKTTNKLVKSDRKWILSELNDLSFYINYVDKKEANAKRSA